MKNSIFLRLAMFLAVAFFPYMAVAQTANVYIGNTDQTITGFGGMNFPRWQPDLTPDEADKAFGTGYGQIGLSMLRVSVPPNSGNWSGELPTAQRAANHGAAVFATPWSPPASMKSNGSTTGGTLNSSSYQAYADHLRDFTNYMASNDAPLYAISVQNEPDFVPDYESCGWTPSEMRTFLDNNASVIPTRVIAPEVVHYKQNWADALVGSSELDILANHNYGGSPTGHSTGKQHWMTEHITDEGDPNVMANALNLGKEIHDFMINGYNAYVWWYIKRYYGLIAEDGVVTKRGFVMSHFARFVRPGFVRVRTDASPTSGVSVSAYQDGNTLVVVAVNQNSSSRSLTLDFSGNSVSNITKWETTGAVGQNVAEVGTYSGGTSLANTLAGESMTTFRGTIESSGGGGGDEIWLEAECGSVGSLWNLASDGAASSGNYATIQPGNNSTGSAPGDSTGHITYDFNVSAAGNYTLWARVIAPNANDDSFWVRVDGGAWSNWNNIAPGSTAWTWDDVASYNLSAGNHSLTIAYREDGAQLDKLYLGASSPSGSGGAAGNCSSGGGAVYQFQNRNTGLFLDGLGLTENGDSAAQWADTSHPNAQWELIDVGGGYYQLRNVGTSLLLDGMGRTENGSDVGMWLNTSSQNAHWFLEQYESVYYRLQNRSSGLYLDGMGRTENGAAAGQWGNTSHSNAQWELISVSSE